MGKYFSICKACRKRFYGDFCELCFQERYKWKEERPDDLIDSYYEGLFLLSLTDDENYLSYGEDFERYVRSFGWHPLRVKPAGYNGIWYTGDSIYNL